MEETRYGIICIIGCINAFDCKERSTMERDLRNVLICDRKGQARDAWVHKDDKSRAI